jgi:hypothetical protein
MVVEDAAREELLKRGAEVSEVDVQDWGISSLQRSRRQSLVRSNSPNAHDFYRNMIVVHKAASL